MMNSGVTSSTYKAQVASVAGECLAFILTTEECGLEVLKVQLIHSDDTVARISEAPEFIKGVINLRGKIMPIVALPSKFHLNQAKCNDYTVVIILNHSNRVDIVVDGVFEVAKIKRQQLRDVPSLVTNINIQYILALATVASKMLVRVGIEQLMRSDDILRLDSVTVH